MLTSLPNANFKLTQNIEEADAITHGGQMHADDVFATAILILLNEVRNNSEPLLVYRAKDEKELEGIGFDTDKDPIIYDIGLGQFDHHQKGGNGRRPNGIPYASAGLLWRRFGKEICNHFGFNMTEMVDKSLIEGIDARDNGVNIESTCEPGQSEESINQYTVSDIVMARNSVYAPNIAFMSSVGFAVSILYTEIIRLSEIWSDENKNIIVEAANLMTNGNILILPKFIQWKYWLNKLSMDNSLYRDIMIVIYPSKRGGYQWMLVPNTPTSFNTKISAPVGICGLPREELRKLFPDAIFIHPNGFTGSNDTLEGAVEVAKYIIDNGVVI